LPPAEKARQWTIEVMGVLEDAENALPLLDKVEGTVNGVR
jgi:hypothetical protein